jgi:hypothetical protein
MSQVQVVSNSQAWNSTALGCGPAVSRVTATASSTTTAGGVSKLRHRPRVSQENNSNKEKEVQPTTDEKALRDESKAARRLLQKKQDAIMSLAQERFGSEAKQEVLNAYAKLAVKWFQKTTEGQTFDAKKVEKQIQQTLEVFSNFLKEWHMDYLLLPGTITIPAFALCSLMLRSFRQNCLAPVADVFSFSLVLQPSSMLSATSACWAASRTSTCSTCSSPASCSRSSSGTIL